MKFMIGLLAAASSLAVATPAYATAYFSGSGSWGTNTPNTTITKKSSIFSFSFDLANPIDANPTNKISNFSYFLDGVKLAVTATQIRFYDVGANGLFDVTTSGGSFSLYGADIENVKNLSLGTYAFTSAYNGGAATGAGQLVVSNTAAVPEPATWAMMMLGFGVVGYSLRRRSVLRFV